jgi:hypothetical protein
MKSFKVLIWNAIGRIRGVAPRNRIESSQTLVDTLVVITDCDATLSGEFAKRKNVVHSLSKVIGADVAHYLLGGCQ